MRVPNRMIRWADERRWQLEQQQVAWRARLGRYRCPLPPPFVIGVVTYIARQAVFHRLLSQLRREFPQTRIVVAVNGYHDQQAQRLYLEQLCRQLEPLPHLQVLPHTEPQALCALWNRILLAADQEKVLILNDDLDLARHFGAALFASGILEREMALINQSWSHFLIAKRIVEQVGWFDERLFGVGGEDWDYEARLAWTGVPLELVAVRGVRNLSLPTRDFSYGREVATVHGKYTLSSATFLRQKWQISGPDDPDGRFVRIWQAHVRLNPGFETPVFYDLARLRGRPPV